MTRIRVFPKIGLSIIIVFSIVLTILLSGTLKTFGAIPNLDEDTQPNRVKLTECIADVQQITSGWDETTVRNAAVNICESRKAHAKEKARFLAALGKLSEQYKDYTNHGFAQHLPTATQDAWTIVKNCIDFKEGFTFPHNVGVLIVPENVRSSCYALGSDMVESQLSSRK